VWVSGLGIIGAQAPSLHTYGAGGEHPTLSQDGRFVSFEAGTSHWVAGDPTANFATFLHDLVTGVSSEVAAIGPEAPAEPPERRFAHSGLRSEVEGNPPIIQEPNRIHSHVRKVSEVRRRMKSQLTNFMAVSGTHSHFDIPERFL
jgi:hypothetical protein